MLRVGKKQWKWWAPLLLILLLTPWTPKLDLGAAHYFYREGHFSNSAFLLFLFKYGELFGFLISAFAACLFLCSYFYKKWKIYRTSALVLIFTFVIGAGLITNVLCKGYLGRPRPKQLEEFGGTLCYRPFWHPNLDAARTPQKSLPSGHVAMGYTYLALIVAGRRYCLPGVTRLGWLLTLFWGPGLMLARIAQGGHFFSDVMLSVCIMWWTTHLVDAVIDRYLHPCPPDKLFAPSPNDIRNVDTTK